MLAMRPLCAILMLSSVLFSCKAQRRFPEWKVSVTGLVGSYENAESVVVGDVTNIAQVGSTKISNPPWPVSPSVEEIY